MNGRELSPEELEKQDIVASLMTEQGLQILVNSKIIREDFSVSEIEEQLGGMSLDQLKSIKSQIDSLLSR